MIFPFLSPDIRFELTHCSLAIGHVSGEVYRRLDCDEFLDYISHVVSEDELEFFKVVSFLDRFDLDDNYMLGIRFQVYYFHNQLLGWLMLV